MPSVRLDRAEAAIGSYIETPIVSSSPLALCQRKHVTAGMRKNVASARLNRTESGYRSDAIFVAANCGPAGMKTSGNPFGKHLGNPAQANPILDTSNLIRSSIAGFLRLPIPLIGFD